IPKSGLEAIWNHILYWNGGAFDGPVNFYLVTADGKASLLSAQRTVNVRNDYYIEGGSPETWNGFYKKAVILMSGPPVRAGEGSAVWANKDSSEDAAWSYFPGQRRVRQLPSPCCDTPNPGLSGLATFDEIANWFGRTVRYDWKIIGKKEVYLPYNENRLPHAPSNSALISGHIYNPEYRRYELHRVWEIEATLKPDQRHIYPKLKLYLDEDNWQAVVVERYDANGELWKVASLVMTAMPDVPMVGTNGYSAIYDIVAKETLIFGVSEVPYNMKIVDPKKLPESIFTPEALASRGVR
ncbi:MAG: DUF1329 domain-containing protein, partial [Sedimentisphaerales bacterium]|nr:DUF1329 domain-containing protein [Sedimentisphaerales bacterium]